MIAAIMQPTFNPWLGYFDLIDQVDCFVFYDDVQLVKRSWQVRNKIKVQGNAHFLSIPIEKTSSRSQTLISNAVISNAIDWKSKHLKTLQNTYKKYPYFELIFEFISKLYSAEYQFLSDFNISIISSICEEIGIKTPLVKSSNLKNISGSKDSRLVSVCKEIQADSYISVQGSADYIESQNPGGEIIKNDIKLHYQVYEHPLYDQRSDEFVPYLGVFDLLFNHGFLNSRSIIISGRRNNLTHLEYRKSNDYDL
ncbi:MAG: WbqC family protein [Ekhidna sp.]